MRAKTRRNATLSADDQAWLKEYELARGALRGVRRSRSTSGATVHVTQPSNDNLDAGAFMWDPKVPAAAPPTDDAGAPPIAEQTTAEPGTPVVEVMPPASAPPVGDEVAAQQFAGLVMFLCGVGVVAGRELLLASAFELPAEIQGFVLDEGNAGKAVAFAGGAAYRVALKYGFRQIPLGDEAVVAAAVGGSALAVYYNWQRKKAHPQAQPQRAKPANDTQHAQPPPVVASPTQPDDEQPADSAAAAENRSLLFGGN